MKIHLSAYLVFISLFLIVLPHSVFGQATSSGIAVSIPIESENVVNGH